jgi:hypothetical protein
MTTDERILALTERPDARTDGLAGVRILALAGAPAEALQILCGNLDEDEVVVGDEFLEEVRAVAGALRLEALARWRQP